MCCAARRRMAEAFFLVQPWTQIRSAQDFCKLCYQERESKEHLPCKQSHLAAYNSILAVVKLEKAPEFEDAQKKLEAAKSACLSAEKPNQTCHGTSQNALENAFKLYDGILDDFRRRLPRMYQQRPPAV